MLASVTLSWCVNADFSITLYYCVCVKAVIERMQILSIGCTNALQRHTHSTQSTGVISISDYQVGTALATIIVGSLHNGE